MKLNLNRIIFREDLYPRFDVKQDYIQAYANAINKLPPIKISQQNILIDGYHRLKAHQLAKVEEIEVEVIEVKSEKELKKLAYQLNSTHGLQLSSDEKQRYAQEMIGEMDIPELAEILSVTEWTIANWTKNQREALEKERNRKIIELYLRAWNTQESVAKEMKVTQQTVSNIIGNFTKNREISEICKDFKPFLYNIWNLQKQDNTVNRFGQFPQVFMENLLYYHTQPLDIVYDPFAGGGTTVDVCKKMFRRYYCTDREIIAGREKDIRQRELNQGIPDDLPKPDLVFLDPPYSLLARGQYSTDKEDLGNMEVNAFFQQFHSFISELLKKKWPVRVAYLIRPFWNINNGRWEWVDPMLEFYKLINRHYDIESRYVIPYSTQQYSGLWVDRAKENKKCLILNRELTVFTKRKVAKEEEEEEEEGEVDA